MPQTQLNFQEINVPESSYAYPSCVPIIKSIQCRHCGYIHYIKVGCGCILCPICSEVRAIRQFRRYKPQILAYRNPALLTLTTVRQKKLNFSELRQQFRIFRHYYSSMKIKGGLYLFETKQKKDGWHTHIHAIIYSDYYPQKQISEEWKQTTHGESYIVDIRRVNVKKALTYVLGYVLKKTEILNEQGALEFIEQSKHTHLFQVFGERYGVRVLKKIKFPCPVCDCNDWSLNVDVHFSQCENKKEFGVG